MTSSSFLGKLSKSSFVSCFSWAAFKDDSISSILEYIRYFLYFFVMTSDLAKCFEWTFKQKKKRAWICLKIVGTRNGYDSCYFHISTILDVENDEMLRQSHAKPHRRIQGSTADPGA